MDPASATSPLAAAPKRSSAPPAGPLVRLGCTLAALVSPLEHHRHSLHASKPLAPQQQQQPQQPPQGLSRSYGPAQQQPQTQQTQQRTDALAVPVLAPSPSDALALSPRASAAPSPLRASAAVQRVALGRPRGPRSPGGDEGDDDGRLRARGLSVPVLPRGPLGCPPPGAEAEGCPGGRLQGPVRAARAEPAVALGARMQRSALGAGDSALLYAMVELAAPESAPEERQRGRPCADVVAVVGLMPGRRLEATAEALRFVLSQLRETDRLCVVMAVGGAPETLLPLGYVDDARRVLATSRLAGMATDPRWACGERDQHRCCLWAGVQLALASLCPRDHICLQTVLVISSGKDDFLPCSEIVREAATVVRERVREAAGTLHTVGVGSDHDALLMSSLAALGDGTYTPLESSEYVGAAVAHALGAVLSTAARHVQLLVEAREPYAITAVRAHFQTTFSVDGRAALVTVPDLCEGERRHVLVVLACPKLDAPAARSPVARVTMEAWAMRSAPVHASLCLELLRAAEPPEPALLPPAACSGGGDLEMEEQHLRFEAVDALRAFVLRACEGDLRGACEVARQAIDSVSRSGVALRPLGVVMLGELTAAAGVEPHRRGRAVATAIAAHMQLAQERGVFSPSFTPTSGIFTACGQDELIALYRASRSRALAPMATLRPPLLREHRQQPSKRN
eukprot:m51a1_g7805 hypothetical protein (684) ;mRNA; f:78485-80918